MRIIRYSNNNEKYVDVYALLAGSDTTNKLSQITGISTLSPYIQMKLYGFHTDFTMLQLTFVAYFLDTC